MLEKRPRDTLKHLPMVNEPNALFYRAFLIIQTTQSTFTQLITFPHLHHIHTLMPETATERDHQYQLLAYLIHTHSVTVGIQQQKGMKDLSLDNGNGL